MGARAPAPLAALLASTPASDPSPTPPPTPGPRVDARDDAHGRARAINDAQADRRASVPRRKRALAQAAAVPTNVPPLPDGGPSRTPITRAATARRPAAAAVRLRALVVPSGGGLPTKNAPVKTEPARPRITERLATAVVPALLVARPMTPAFLV